MRWCRSLFRPERHRLLPCSANQAVCWVPDPAALTCAALRARLLPPRAWEGRSTQVFTGLINVAERCRFRRSGVRKRTFLGSGPVDPNFDLCLPTIPALVAARQLPPRASDGCSSSDPAPHRPRGFLPARSSSRAYTVSSHRRRSKRRWQGLEVRTPRTRGAGQKRSFGNRASPNSAGC